MQRENLWISTYTVSFFGHRVIENPLLMEQQVERLVHRLLLEKEYVEFLVGRNGDFDQIVSSTIRRCKRSVRDDNSAHIWVMPYATVEFREHKESFQHYYDEIEICDDAAAGYFKRSYQTRNRRMVDRSNLAVFCIQHEDGGAWQTMKYAKKQGVPYVNLAQMTESGGCNGRMDAMISGIK